MSSARGVAAQKPWIEVRRKLSVGCYRTYATAYKRPLRVWVLGHWIIGGKAVREAWAAVERANSDAA